MTAAASTYAETVGFSSNPGGVTNTWTNYTNAGGVAGPTINPYNTVQILCALPGFRVTDGNTWWYQIASSPWNNLYYASADAFYNNGQTSGSLIGTPFVDPAVPTCASLAGGTNETTGGPTGTFTNYLNAGGTVGPSIGSGQTVQIACALIGFRVQDGNTWWYQIASPPWSHAYYASADAFYNDGRTSGSLAGTPFVDPAVPLCSSGGGGSGGTGITEQEGRFGVTSFANYQNASGPGPNVPASANVQVSCKIYAPGITSVNPDGYWYRIASSPWNDAYYAPANTFMNGDPAGGPYTHNTDFAVPDCGGAPRAGSPTVSLVQGPAAPAGFRYAVSLAGFAPNTAVSVVCYDSISSGGFYQFRLTTDGSGSASTASFCYSGDGPDHWVVVNGVYGSTHAAWGSGGGGGTSRISSSAAGNQGSTPPRSQYSTTCSTLRPVNCATGNFWHTFQDFAIPGRGVALDLSHTYSSSAADVAGPLGFGWTDSYNMSLSTDASGGVTVNEEDGVSVTFTPDGAGGFTAPARVLATMVSNQDGTYTFTRRASTVQYVFSTYGQLVQEVDRNGYTTSLGYSGSLLTSVTDPAGRALTLTYDGTQISKINDPMGRSETFSYDMAGNLVSATTARGQAWTFTYDAHHLLLTMTDPRSGVTTNVYDGSDRVVNQTDPAGAVTTWSYAGDNSSPAGGVTTMTDPNGSVTTFGYTDLELLSVTHAAGTALASTTSYTYDTGTLGVTSVVDPNGHTTTYTYDSRGNELTKTDALGRKTMSTYNSFNEPLAITDPTGAVTTYSYDAHGNQVTKAAPLGATTTTAYGDAGHPGDATAVTDPAGVVTNLTYDSNGNVVAKSVVRSATVTDTTRNVYDVDGEPTCSASPNATAAGQVCPAAGGAYVPGTTATAYDSGGEVISVTDPLGHTTGTTYDGNGNRTKVTDPLGQATTFTYDPDDRLTKTTKPSGSSTTTAYDGNGNAVTATDAKGHVTTNVYDALNRLVSTTDPLGLRWHYAYDAAGNRTSYTSRFNDTTTYGYDQADELTSVNYSNGQPSIGYTYDLAGRRLTMTDGTGTTASQYDALGRATSVTDGIGSSVGYGYDADGNVTSLMYPNGKTVTKAYDGAGNLLSLTDWLGRKTTFAYDGDRNVLKEVTGSTPTVTDTYTYDAADDLLSISDIKGVKVLQGFTYTRNANALLASVTPLGKPTSAYGYDAASQLTADAKGPYTYDPAGNVTTITSAAPLTYNADDQLVSQGKGKQVTKFLVNANGERITMTRPTGVQSQYLYDQTERMIGYSSGLASDDYGYNGDGLRATKRDGQTHVLTRYVWDPTPATPLILSDGQASYIYGPGGLPVESIDGAGVVSYFHHDQLGSTTMLTSVKAAKVATFTYSSYGSLLSGTAVTPLLFAGQYRDAETGFYYLRARYYDPATAQFTTMDPLVNVTGEPYGYAYNNPTTNVDPTGLGGVTVCFGLCIAYDSKNGLGAGFGVGVSASGGVFGAGGGPSGAKGFSTSTVAYWNTGQLSWSVGTPFGGIQLDEQGGYLTGGQACVGLGQGGLRQYLSLCTPDATNWGAPSAGGSLPQPAVLPWLKQGATQWQSQNGILQSYSGPACGLVRLSA